jgi:hypothetical protein
MPRSRSGKSKSVISRLKGLLSITEPFTRSDNASLGFAASSSSQWSNVRGSWAIATNKASSATAGSSYPLATLVFTKEDVTLSVDEIGPGVGTAFWVTDSNNWWGTYQDATQTCQTCTNTSNCATYVTNTVNVAAVPGNCATYSTVCSSYNAPVYNGEGYSPAFCSAGPCPAPSVSRACNACGGPGCCPAPYTNCCAVYGPRFSPGTCSANSTPCNAYNATTPAYSYTVSNCSTYNAVTNYDCNCTTAYSVKLIKSVSGTVSQVASFAIASIAVGMKTVLSGNTVTVKAYASTSYASQIGADQSTTVTGYTKTKKHGILKASTTYSPAQTSVIGSFGAE